MPKVDEMVNRAPIETRAKGGRTAVPFWCSPDLRGLVVPIDSLSLDPWNARLHPEINLEAIRDSLRAFGQLKPIVVRRSNMTVMAGNGTLEAARSLGWDRIAATVVDLDDAQAAAYGLADNRTAELATWDYETVAMLGSLIAEAGGEMVGWDNGLLEKIRGQTGEPDQKVSLSDRFIVPPFSVLDARQGYWQARKRVWLALGIQSELGRGIDRDNGLLEISEQARSHYKLAPGGSPRPATKLVGGKTVRGDGRGRSLGTTFGSGALGDLAAGFKAKKAIPGGGTGKNSAYLFKTPEGYKSLKDIQAGETASLKGGVTHGTTIHHMDGSSSPNTQSGTSIFDPVVCELVYRWFTPPQGTVLDPFAGGSVRGIVAAKLGKRYTGIDLSGAQLAANEEQAARIVPDLRPKWVVGDSSDILKSTNKTYDLVFSCPPYADLEQYSDDPRDLSTMDYPEFLKAYRKIIKSACNLLKPNRFACFVVGDVRDKAGNYRGFVCDTIAAFQDAGLSLYNDAVLVTAVGSLPIRVGKQFSGYRKLGKTHQSVLVFIKGDAAKAVRDCGPVDVTGFEELIKGATDAEN